VVPKEFLGGAICEWASAPPSIALVAKSPVSSGQLAGGELTGNGKFNSGPGRDREARADLPCYKVLRRFELHPRVALLLHRGSRRGVYKGGSHDLELVTRLTASETDPAALE
jgi:hypothetical protein